MRYPNTVSVSFCDDERAENAVFKLIWIHVDIALPKQFRRKCICCVSYSSRYLKMQIDHQAETKSITNDVKVHIISIRPFNANVPEYIERQWQYHHPLVPQ